jgi:hypothetical protein
MAGKNDNWKKDHDDIKNELLMDKVGDVFRKNPTDWRKDLEEMGFTWVDDGQKEDGEENHVVAENTNQEYLVVYFEGQMDFNSSLIDIFIEETETDKPNYPLFRRYFKSGNSRLIQLLITGLTDAPTNQTLLSGLGYFHENNQILSKLITIYSNACEKEQNIEKFKELCIDFSIYTQPDGYDAIADLKLLFQADEHKLRMLEEVTEIMGDLGEVVDF